MIITRIRIQEEHPMTGSSGTWPLPLCDLNLDHTAGDNGYVLKAAQGLDPSDLIAVVDGFDANGVPIMDSFPLKREIIFRIGLSPGIGQSYSSLRDDLYKFISRTVYVKFMNGTITNAQTVGFIKRVEALHFASQPEIQITIECEDGVLFAPSSVNIPLEALATDEPVINYDDGTAPTGFELEFSVTEATAGFTIFNHAQFWFSGAASVTNQFEVTYDFEIDDIVTLVTQQRIKRLTVLRSAVTIDIAGFINAGAVWPKLYSGVNTFEWTLDSTVSGWMDWISAKYTPRYWGV